MAKSMAILPDLCDGNYRSRSNRGIHLLCDTDSPYLLDTFTDLAMLRRIASNFREATQQISIRCLFCSGRLDMFRHSFLGDGLV